MKRSGASTRSISKVQKMLAILLSFVLMSSLIPAPAFAGSGVITPQATDISTATLSTIYEQTWTGSAITPEPTVIDGATTLVKDTDYTLSYTNNVSLGTATVTATGIGGYSGAVSENFTITPFVYNVVTDNGGPYGNGAYITNIVGGVTNAVVPATLGGANVVSVWLYGRGLVSLDVSAATGLSYLECTHNTLAFLDVSANTQLDYIGCANCSLTSLDVSANTQLTVLDCSFNSLTSLDVSVNTQLTLLNCRVNSLASLDVSANTQLTMLDCRNNSFDSLDVSTNTQLTHFSCCNNLLTSLDVSANTQLENLYCDGNYIADTSALEAWLATSGHIGQILPQNQPNISLATLSTIHEQTWTGSAVTPLPTVTLGVNTLVKDTDYTLSYTNNVDLGTATVAVTGIGSYTGSASENFTITPFVYTVVTDGSGAYGNGTYITYAFGGITDAAIPATLGGMNVVSAMLSSCGLVSLDASAATELKYLVCAANFSLTSLNVSANTQLLDLACPQNSLTSLDVSHNAQLTSLVCDISFLTSLDVSANTQLTHLTCSSNPLTSLDVSTNTQLVDFYCYNDHLTSLDISANTQLTDLRCQYNYIADTSALEAWLATSGHTGFVLPQNTPDLSLATLSTIYEQTWTGSAVTPQPTVTYGGLTLAKDTDYTLSYANNVDLGTATVTVTGIGGYTGTKSENFTITPFTYFMLTDGSSIYGNGAYITGIVSGMTDVVVPATLGGANVASLELQSCGLTTLDISSVTGLKYLDCNQNSLASLDVSTNTQLMFFACRYNSLTSLDLSANTQLGFFACSYNSLSSLDVSANTQLEFFLCDHNSLTSLDVSTNTNLSLLDCGNNYIADTSALEAWLAISGHSGQVLPQNQFDISTATLSTIYEQTWTGSAITPEPTVTYGGNTLVKDTDYTLSYTNNVDLGTATVTVTGIGSFGGTKSENFTITPFIYHVVTDGSEIGNGAYIDDIVGGVTDVVVPATLGGTDVVSVDIMGDGITSLDVSANTQLVQLVCGSNQLTALDVSANTLLDTLYCGNNQLTVLDISANTLLIQIVCDNNQLTALDVSANTLLDTLYCGYNQLTALNVSANTQLTRLACDSNQLTSLDVSANTQLTLLTCYDNRLTSLDVSANTQLAQFACEINQLTALDISANTLLHTFYCSNNYIADTSALEVWLATPGHFGWVLPQNQPDISLATLSTIYEQTWTGSAITPEPTVTYGGSTLMKGIDYTLSYTNNVNLGTATVTATGIGSYTGTVSENFTITPFTYYNVTDGHGNWGNGTYITSVVGGITHVTVPAVLNGADVVSVSFYDQGLISLDVSSATALHAIDCVYNSLISLDLSANAQLTYLRCYENPLTSLDLSTNTQLQDLFCAHAHIATLDLSNNTQLKQLGCAHNSLTSLDLSTNTQLGYLDCQDNSLTSLDVSANPLLMILYCQDNSLTSLDISANTQLINFWCNNNLLTSLDVAANAQLQYLFCQYNYISDTSALEAWLATSGHHGQVLPQYTWDISLAQTAAIPDETYTGSTITPEPVIVYGGNTLVKDTDYTLSYADNIEVGTATIIITGMGNYTGTTSVTFEITCRDIASADVVSISDQTYIGSAITPAPALTYGATTLMEGVDYTLSYSDNINVGTASITAFGIGHYQGSKIITFNIVAADISTATLSTIYEQTWTGSAVTPLPTVTYSGTPLVKDTDYTLSYTNNVDLGTATVTVTGIGSYTGAVSKNFTITPFFYYVITDGSGAYGNGAYITAMTGGITDMVVPVTLGGANVVSVELSGYSLTALDVSAALALKMLSCIANNLVTLDVSHNTALEDLYCSGNLFTSLDISHNSSLEEFICAGNQLTSIDVSNNVALTVLDCSFNNLASLDVSHNTPLETLYCAWNFLTSLDISSNTQLNSFACENNSLTSLDVSHTTQLVQLSCNNNVLISLDVSANTLLTTLYCDYNYIIHTAALENWLAVSGHVGAVTPQNTVDITGAGVVLNPRIYTYTGSGITPVPVLTYSNGADTVALIEGTDYTLAYSDNVNVGTATITITGTGNCTGTTSATFDIVAADIASASIALIADETWTGSAITPLSVITFNGATLVKDTDYTLSYADNIEVGRATVTVSGIGNFKSSTDVTFNIIFKDITLSTIGAVPNQTWTGNAITPSLTVTYETITLVRDSDYTISYIGNTGVGTATIVISGIGHYRGNTSTTFNIVARDIVSATVAPVSDQTWTGSAITPLPVATFNGMTLVKDTDYTLSYVNNINVGTATITLTGINNLSGSRDVTFDIVGKDIASTVVTPVSKKLYTGSPVEPLLTIQDGSYTLVKDIDYTLSYTNNTLNGTATATASGIGHYTNTTSINFSVVRFSDVSYDLWYITDGWLTYVVENDLMSGYAGTTDFGPFDFISRAQVATVLYRAACKDDPSLVSIYGSTTDPSHYATTTVFVDEAVGVYYTAAINWAQAAGIMTGYAPEYRVVAPDNMISREELCTMIARYVRVVDPTKGAQTGPVDYSNIRGMDEVFDWARANVQWCASWGIVGGLNRGGGIFDMCPRDPAWRASMAKMITVSIRDVIG